MTEYYKEITAYAISLTRDRERGKDLAQDVFLKAHRFRDRFEPGTNERAWLYKICKNTFIDEYRKRQNTPQHISINAFEGVTPKEWSQSHIYFEEPFSDEVFFAFRCLNENQRECIYLHFVVGLSYHDIADLHEVNYVTVITRINRALRKIRRVMGIADTKIHRIYNSHSKNEFTERGEDDDPKTCQKCYITKTYADFHNNKSWVDGVHPYCKLCMKEYNKVRNQLKKWSQVR